MKAWDKRGNIAAETKLCPESKKVFGKFEKQFLLLRLRYCVFYIYSMMVQMMRHLGNIVQTPTLTLLTHVRLVRQNVLISSEVSLYVERSKNLEKKNVIKVQKKFTFLRGFDRKNKVLEYREI